MTEIVKKDNFRKSYTLSDLKLGMHVSWEELTSIHDVEIVLTNTSRYQTSDGCVYIEGDITMIDGKGTVPDNFTRIYNAVDTDGGVSDAYYCN